MLLHEFRPGRLVAGLFLIAAGIVGLGDAAGMWTAPWFASLPLAIGGLVVAGLVGSVTYVLRTRSSRGSRSGQGVDVDPSEEEIHA